MKLSPIQTPKSKLQNGITQRRLRPNFHVHWRGIAIIAIPVVCFIISLITIAGMRSKISEAREQEEKSTQILIETADLMEALINAETGVRGYGLTGRPDFLEPYSEAKALLPNSLERLEVMVSDNPARRQQVQEIQSQARRQIVLLEEKIGIIDRLEQTSRRYPELTQQLLLSKSRMDELREQIAEFNEQEERFQRELKNQTEQWRALTTRVQWLALGVGIMASGAAIYLFYQLGRELSGRATCLRESNMRLQAIFDNVIDGILILNQRDYIESSNITAVDIFGYEPEEISGTHLQWLVEESLIGNSGEAFSHFVGNNQNKLDRFQEVVGRRKQGTTFPMEFAISKLQLDRQDCFIAIVRDITQRKQAEETLRKQAQLLDLANDLILVDDFKDSITYWNQGAERLSGWTAEEALGKSLHELLKTEFLRPLEEIQAEFFQKGEWKGELVHTNKNGCQIAVASSWTLQRDKDGKPTAKLEIDKDITAAKLAEAALRESKELYRTLVKNFPDGAVFLFDEDLRYMIAEGTGLGTLNLESESLVGKTLWETLSPKGAQKLEPIYRAALAGEATVTEMPIGERIYRVYVLPVTNEDGEVFSGMVMKQDITDSKRAEETLRSRANELARLTTILAQTTGVLEKRNQELDQFAYIVSHDLKAPLRAIANLSSWIEEDLEGQLDEDTQHQMDLLRGRAHRMEALINGLLQYSRVGRIKTDGSSVNVEQLLVEVIDSLDPPPEFTITVMPGVPTLNTERFPLEQVFSNLISNAIKHHNRSDGKIVISVQDQGDVYEFAVADDGPGIESEYQEKVFVMFQTLQPRDKVENTGVGLAIVKKIIEDQGGAIWIESQVGQGATFYFTWPK